MKQWEADLQALKADGWTVGYLQAKDEETGDSFYLVDISRSGVILDFFLLLVQDGQDFLPVFLLVLGKIFAGNLFSWPSVHSFKAIGAVAQHAGIGRIEDFTNNLSSPRAGQPISSEIQSYSRQKSLG